MMNIQLTPQLYFSNTATAACVVIACARVASLLSPVGTIVGFIAALPVEIVFTRNGTDLRLTLTGFRAKPAPAVAGQFYLKLFTTLRAILSNTLLQMRLLPSHAWTRDTFTGFGNMFAITYLRTKIVFRGLHLIEKFFERLSTIFAIDSNRLFPNVLPKVVESISGATFDRAVFTRPGSVIPKFLAALWAIRDYSRSVTLTLTRTIDFWLIVILRWVIGKADVALWANGHNLFSVHCYSFSNMKVSKLYHRRSNHGR
jgi:hypothetical protein